MYIDPNGGRWKGCQKTKPYKAENFKGVEVETIAKYKMIKNILHSQIYGEHTDTPDEIEYVAEYEFEVPRIKATVSNADLINQDINEDQYFKMIELLNRRTPNRG